MALQSCGLNLDRTSREMRPHGTIDFPCAGYAARYDDRPGDVVPWHWHGEMEVMRVTEGAMLVRVPAARLQAEAGDLVCVNANVLHCARALCPSRLDSIVFAPSLVAGGEESVFWKRYLQPLTGCAAFDALRLPAGESEAAAWFGAAFEALEKETRGFEFAVRESLSRLCVYLSERFLNAGAREAQSADAERMRAMLCFIHEHFAEPVALCQIARVGNVGARECLRCFQRTVGVSPIQYLIKYRVMRAEEMLLADAGRSVAEIAAACGFDSPSNFAKMFRRFYGAGPREYRRKNAPSARVFSGARGDA